MAKAPKNAIEQMIDSADADASAAERIDGTPQQELKPSYQVYPETRIPVSKHMGTSWKGKYDSAISKMKSDMLYEAWDETVSYYKNDQTGKRNRENPDLPTRGTSKDITGGPNATTENVVFANVSALVPSIYAKNPDVSVYSPKGDTDLPFTTMCQKLIRTLMNKRTAPGINLKPKARRAVVLTTLTNISFIEVGYTKKADATEGTLAEIDAIAKQLEDAKSPKEIEDLYGKLQALEDKVDLLQPAGPWTRVLNPKDVIIDPDATLIDCSDAKWVMIREVYDTSFLNAVYRRKDENGRLTSLYKPTHVLRAGTTNSNMAGHDEEITSFSLLANDKDKPSDYGYDDERAYSRAQRTFCWKVWDRITRRVYLFAENDWKWPIWVWDDPYGFDDFFSIHPLAFHTDPESLYARGEASYYLDQQDEINAINSQVSRMRYRVSNTIVYNKRHVKEEKELLNLFNPVSENGLVGFDLPDGVKMEDVVMAPPIPAVDYQQLFDKRSNYEAIDRVSGVSAVIRGAEFKTNTTNQAIDSYESSSAMRLDEKIDAIEELIGRVGNAILILCLQFMDADQVARLIGPENAAAWPGNMAASEAAQAFQLTVTGGSSLKPTSRVRKEQAKETAQIIGQFGASQPVAFLVVLKMFQRAFSDEIVLEPQDWEMIIQAVTQQIGAPPAGEAGGSSGSAQGGSPEEIIGRLGEMIVKMPPELRQQVGKDIASGVPLPDIIGKLQQLQQGAQQQQGPQQQPAQQPPVRR